MIRPAAVFSPTPGNTGDIIRSIAGQPHDVDDLLRLKFIFGDKRPVVRKLVFHRIPEGGLFGNDLPKVLVSRDDNNVEGFRLRPTREGADNIVRLVARFFDRTDIETLDDILDVGDLADEVFRRRGPVRLVLGKDLVPEGGSLGVKNDGRVLGGLLAEEGQDHINETEDGVGGKPLGVREASDGVIGAIDIGTAI